MTGETSKTVVVPTLDHVADAYGVSRNTVRDWRRWGMPGKQGAYRLRDISNWLRTEGPWRPKATPRTGDPLLDAEQSGESVGLERYRLAKAELAELELRQRKGDLIVRAECRVILRKWGDIIKRCRNRLFKNHGLEARRILDKAVENCQRLLDSELGDNTPD